LDATTFRHDLNFGQTKDPATKAYRKALLDALPMAMSGGVQPSDIADASLFSTQSITAITDKIRAQLTASTPTFTLGTNGERTVFPFAFDHVDPVETRGPDRADVLDLVPADAGSRGRRRHDRVRLVRLAGLRDVGRGHPAVR